MFAIKLSMKKRINFFLAAWFSDLPAINATVFRKNLALPTFSLTISISSELHSAPGWPGLYGVSSVDLASLY